MNFPTIEALKLALMTEHEINNILFRELTKNWTEQDKKEHTFWHDEETCDICNEYSRYLGFKQEKQE